MHLKFEDPAIREWLTKSSGLSEIAVNALVSEETRPRSVNRGDRLLLSLRGVNLAPQREAMNRLINENLTWLDELNRLRLREINDRMIRYIEDIDEVRDRAAGAGLSPEAMAVKRRLYSWHLQWIYSRISVSKVRIA